MTHQVPGNNEMEENKKQVLLQQFSDYLDNGFVPDPPGESVDMISLFRELAGLKNEVRIESRQLKTALDDFRNAFQSLDGSQQDTAGYLRQMVQDHKQSPALPDPALWGLIDLYDRVRSGLEQQPPEPTFFQRLAGNTHSRKWFEGYMEGQKILLGRIEDLLGQYTISVMDAEGAPFNPQIMKAEGFRSDPLQEEGIVLYEFRKGFRLERRIVRPAEVIVNKREIND